MSNPTSVAVPVQSTDVVMTVNTIRASDLPLINTINTSVIPTAKGPTTGLRLGTAGNDVFNGTSAADRYNGAAGNDRINGFSGNDELRGGDGNDTVDGGLGNDSLWGDAGNDSLLGGDGNDTVDGGTGNDILRGNAGNDRLLTGAGNDTADGGAGNDVLLGDAGTDSLLGGEGNDTIEGGADNDTVDGGTGNDLLRGDAGNDRLLGGAGNDTADGGTGTDSLSGDAGADSLLGGEGNDTIDGGADHDILRGDAGNDSLLGGDGNDTLYGGTGDDVLTGGSGNDYLQGDTGNNQLSGSEGNDTLVGAPGGSGTLDGGAGDDLFLVSQTRHDVRGGDGYDTLDLSGLSTQTGYGTASGVTVDLVNQNYTTNSVNNSVSGIERVIGSSGSDRFSSNGEAAHSFIGGKGHDRFSFYGNAGNAEGGEGNDTYLFDFNQNSFGKTGSLKVKYTEGSDSLLFKSNYTAKVLLTTAADGADLLVTAVLSTGEGTATKKVTVEGGAKAYAQGLLQIGEASNSGSIVPIVDKDGNVLLAGTHLSDSLSVLDARALAPDAPNVIMAGEGGADTFILAPTGRYIVVSDFNPFEGDRIVFTKDTDVSNLSQVKAGFYDNNGYHFRISTPDHGITEYCFTNINKSNAQAIFDAGGISFGLI